MMMTNGEAFEYDFGIYATELWAMTEEQFLEWLNAPCDRERPRDMIVRCKDCKYGEMEENGMYFCNSNGEIWNYGDFFCSDGERKD